METFKQATKEKLRFQTSKGVLTIEQLWDLSLTDLDALAVSLETEHKESGKKSFLLKSSAKDKTTKLKFDIVLDVLVTKVDEMNAATEAKEIREHNTKILTLIAEKQDEALKGKSINELMQQLR